MFGYKLFLKKHTWPCDGNISPLYRTKCSKITKLATCMFKTWFEGHYKLDVYKVKPVKN